MPIKQVMNKLAQLPLYREIRSHNPNKPILNQNGKIPYQIYQSLTNFDYSFHSFQGVRKASLRRRLGAKAQLEVEASRRLEKWSKATLCR
jgi:hypothetical protein